MASFLFFFLFVLWQCICNQEFSVVTITLLHTASCWSVMQFKQYLSKTKRIDCGILLLVDALISHLYFVISDKYTWFHIFILSFLTSTHVRWRQKHTHIYIYIYMYICMYKHKTIKLWTSCTARRYVFQKGNFLILTHWDRDKMATISQTTLWNAFSWMKILELLIYFQRNRFELTVSQHGFR